MTTDPFNPALRETEPFSVLLSSERHRAKNTLQVVASLLSLQAREVVDPSVRGLFVSAQERVRMIALVYERLSRGGASERLDFGEALKEIVGATVRARSTQIVSTQVFADSLWVDLDTAIPLALISYELLCDSLGSAFLERATGRLEVTLRVPSGAGECLLTFADDGPVRPPLAASGPEALRGKIVDVLIRQLKARLTLESVSGTKLAIRFPLPA